MEKIRIQDKHPGSATLHVCLVADPYPASANGSDLSLNVLLGHEILYKK